MKTGECDGNPIDNGQAALLRGDWAAARAAFELALQAGESAPAHEGLSWAAWWLNEGTLVMRSRQSAYRLYRQAGDHIGAARMAMWLGNDCEDFSGEFAVARGWRRRARRLLEGQPPAPEHGWLPILEGEAAVLFEDDTGTARRCAAEAIEIARRCDEPDIEIMAVAIDGLALVSEGRIEDGMSRLDEAAAAVLGGELNDESWANKVLCYLIFACERVRDFGRAAQWCESLREVAERLQLTFAQGVCRAHYGSVLIHSGAWQDAEATLTDAASFLERSRPPWVAEANVRLADLRRRQGRFEEAAALLAEVEWHPNAALGFAELALEAGRLQDAEERIGRFLRRVPGENRLQRAAALELLVRVAALSGQRARAAEALAELRAITDGVPSPPLKAATRFSAASVALAAGDTERARACLEDAIDLFDRSGTPYEAARARLELAALLVALGRVERAREEATRARAALAGLGAEFSMRRGEAILAELDRAAAAPEAAGPAELTARQTEILRLVAEGLSNREIAERLGVSAHTVHRHVGNILIRLDAPTRAAAAARATGLGLL